MIIATTFDANSTKAPSASDGAPDPRQTPTTPSGGTREMAMATPGTAAGDFFVVVGDITSMDAKPGEPGFAVFGRVIEGMDVIRRILVAPTSPTAGEGVMKGQMLDPVIRITSARRMP